MVSSSEASAGAFLHTLVLSASTCASMRDGLSGPASPSEAWWAVQGEGYSAGPSVAESELGAWPVQEVRSLPQTHKFTTWLEKDASGVFRELARSSCVCCLLGEEMKDSWRK